jgi:hypothetical protein
MLYPLSYEGARAQSSDLGVHLGWQGVAHVHPRHPDPCSPSPGPHPEHTNPGLRPAVGRGDPHWHGLTRVDIRWRAHTAHIIQDHGAARSPGLGVAGPQERTSAASIDGLRGLAQSVTRTPGQRSERRWRASRCRETSG